MSVRTSSYSLRQRYLGRVAGKLPADRIDGHRLRLLTRPAVRAAAQAVFALAIVATVPNVHGQVAESASDELDPYEAVKKGNALFRLGKPDEAARLYDRARRHKPDAREIAFDQGLALYELGRYEEARQKFREAAAKNADELADDALYSEGACYHEEALAAEDSDPQHALSHLEAAMQRYQDVLAHRPDHRAARDANYKAGTMWRRLKERMQQQQAAQNDEREGKENESQDNSDRQQPEETRQQDEQRSQPDQNKERKRDEQEQPQTQTGNEPKQQDQPSEQHEQDRPPEGRRQQQEARADRGQRVSREQAMRQLREMMQAIRQRKKNRREPVRLVPVQPVEKDW